MLAPWVCALDQNEKLDWTTATALLGFATGKASARKLFEELDPVAVNSNLYEGRDTSADIACRVIANGRGAL